MSNGFLEQSDFEEQLKLKESATLGGNCFFDVQFYGGMYLGYRYFLNLNDNSFLILAEEVAMKFRKPEELDQYMKEEERLIAIYGNPVPAITLPALNPACQKILTAGKHVNETGESQSFRLFCSIRDDLHVIRIVLGFHVNNDATPVPQIESILQKAVEKSRESRRLGF